MKNTIISSGYVGNSNNISWSNPSTSSEFSFDKKEDEILQEIQEHIKSTYTQHYCGPGKKVQVIDLELSLGLARDSFRANIIKYIARYGQKEGYNKKDLLKAAHYITLLIYCDFYRDPDFEPNKVVDNLDNM